MIWIPISHLIPFYQHLEAKGYDVDQIDNDTLELEWRQYIPNRAPVKNYKPSWLNRFNPFGQKIKAAL